jgi:hypothetical protein
MSLMPTPTYGGAANDTSFIPYANGTRQDCATYVTAPVLTNQSTNASSYSCSAVTQGYSVDLSDFLSWNPSLNPTDCTLSSQFQYCAQQLPQQSLDITEYCVHQEISPAGYECTNFTAFWGVEQDLFSAWNPQIGPGCANFQNGKSVLLVAS